MKLLLDENLSRRILPFIQDAYPGSTQVTLLGKESASDQDLWKYAKDNDYVIVTKDADFQELSLIHGAPPKVLWLRVGNTTKAKVAKLLIDNHQSIHDALSAGEVDCLELN
jgi:predicted nuclease of predicted toxin-antitoxin system